MVIECFVETATLAMLDTQSYDRACRENIQIVLEHSEEYCGLRRTHQTPTLIKIKNKSIGVPATK